MGVTAPAAYAGRSSMHAVRLPTILIVENNSAVRSLVREIVTPGAGLVYECADGRDALAAYVAHRPDLVLMDIAMPGLDGISATLQIRRADPAARVVIVTNHDLQELRDAATRAGTSGYVLKTNLLELRTVVAAFMNDVPDR
jgi:CheY-like chemotaxis protein